MIRNIVVGNILDEGNASDIIIGMNTTFADVMGIAQPFVELIRKTRKVTPGTVVSFKYDRRRQLHMLVCHAIGKGGWEKADQYVRYGMDYLWNVSPGRTYSVVNIGTGRVGRRDGANHALILGAMTQSFLPVDLYILDEKERMPAEAVADVVPLRPFRMWNMNQGETPIRLAA